MPYNKVKHWLFDMETVNRFSPSVTHILIVAIVAVPLLGFVYTFIGTNDSLQPTKISDPILEDTANQITKTCAREPDQKFSKRLCYSEELEKVAFAQGMETAFQLLDIVQEKDKDAKECHRISHGIGRGAFEKDPTQWFQAVGSPYTGRCRYGALHGVLERYDAVAPKGWMTSETLSSICSRSTNESSCYHGLGHIVLVSTQGNIEEGIAICSSLQKTRSQPACFEGLFMEHGTAFMLVDHGLVTQESARSLSRFQYTGELCRSLEGIVAEA